MISRNLLETICQFHENSLLFSRKSKEDLLEFCGNSVYVDLNELSTRHHARHSAIVEPTIPGAKSILLTEDNLSNYVDYSKIRQKRRYSTDLEPDLIQVIFQSVEKYKWLVNPPNGTFEMVLRRSPDEFIKYNFFREINSILQIAT